MSPEPRSRFSLGLQGSAALFVAIAVVALLLITLPTYRLFFLISVLIGLVIAGGLALWHHTPSHQRGRHTAAQAPPRTVGIYFLATLAMRNPNTGHCLHADPGAIHVIGK